MLFVKHSTSARRRDLAKRLLNEYGLAGYGYVWYCIEEIMRSGGTVPRESLTAKLSYKGLSKSQIVGIFSSFIGIFQTSPDGFTSLTPTALREFTGMTTPMRTPAGTPAGTAASTAAGTAALILNNFKDKDKDKEEEEEVKEPRLLTPAEFEHRMILKYPFIMKFQSPLTQQQYIRASDRYGEKLVQRIIRELNSYPDCERKYRNAYLTVCNWCRHSK